MRNKVIIILFSLISISCHFDLDWDIQLWEQKIENSNLSIYKFDASGGRDTMISGIKILNSEKGFSQGDVISGSKLSYLLKIPNKKEIKGVYRLDNSSLKNKEEINLKNTETDIKGYRDYKGKYKKNPHGHYRFESFKETRDSLIFYSNNSVYVNGVDFKRISVPKGNIYLMTSKDYTKVTQIKAEIVIFIKEEKTGETKFYTEWKVFDPVNEIRLNELSDYGIYKPIKTTANRVNDSPHN